VGLFLYNNDNITGFLTWELVCLTVESELHIVGSALVDLSVENFLLLCHLFALANLALVGFVDNFTLATAVITWALRLGVHARSKLGHTGDHTLATASSALLDSAFFTSETIARCANAVSVDSNFGRLAIIDLFECAFHWVHDGLALLRSSLLPAAATTSATEHAEQVLHTTVTVATTTFFETIFSIFVIKFALLTI